MQSLSIVICLTKRDNPFIICYHVVMTQNVTNHWVVWPHHATNHWLVWPHHVTIEYWAVTNKRTKLPLNIRPQFAYLLNNSYGVPAMSKNHLILLTAKHRLGHSLLGFWPSYCQISTDLDKILHTPIDVWNTLVGWLRPRLTSGRLHAKPEWLGFLILVTHRKSYIDNGLPQFWRKTIKMEVRTGAIVKNSGIL